MNSRVPFDVETEVARSALGDPGELENKRRITLPFLFVLISLAALLLIPPAVLYRATADRRRLEVTESAHRLVSELQLGFARSAAVARSYLVRPDPTLRTLFSRLQQMERVRFDSLETIGRDLGIAVEVNSLRRRATEWHADQARLLSNQLGPDEYERRHPLARFMDDELLRPAESIAAKLEGRAMQLQRVVVRTERTGAATMAILTLLAAGSALIVARAARSFRVQAHQEHMLRDAALLLTEAVRLPAVLERIAIAAARVGHARSAFVERVVGDRREVEIVASVGELALPQGIRKPFADSLTQLALTSDGPTIIPDVTRSPLPVARQIRGEQGRCSALVNCLSADQVVHGALVLVRCDHDPYRASDVEQVRIFAVLASLAIRSAAFLDDAERRHRELQQVTESRERLIRGFTHDVKNPLGAADGYAQLLEAGVITDPRERDESIRRIRETINRALSLIDEIVELARAEGGQVAVRYQAVSIPELTRRTMNDFRAAAETSGHTLVDELPSQLPTIRTDANRVHQILSNLLSNAMKYTPKGGTVRVGAALRDRRGTEPGDWITISVADSGPGIPPDQQKMLFQEFVRLQPAAGAGAGLGLAISRRIARLLGGDVTLESGRGVGSTFTLWLPLERRADSNRRQTRAA